VKVKPEAHERLADQSNGVIHVVDKVLCRSEAPDDSLRDSGELLRDASSSTGSAHQAPECRRRPAGGVRACCSTLQRYEEQTQ
jgi:hypothetical protein